jgi:hypothetical protein
MLVSLPRGLADDRQRLICGERGGSCALRGRSRGPVAVKASGGLSERPLIKGCNDVVVDRLDQACRFLVSLGFLLSVFATWLFGRSNNRRGTGPCVRGRPGGTRSGAASSRCSSEGEILYWSLDLLLIGPFLGGAANGTHPPTARQSRPARQIQQ